MTHTIKTLQEKLEERARKEATERAEAAIQSLPYFEQVTIPVDGKEAIVQNYWVLNGLRRAITERLYAEILKSLTSELLDTVNRLDELTSRVEETES